MTSLWDIHHKNIKTDIKFTQILFILSFISMIFCCIGALISLYKPSSKEEVNLAFLAVFISLLALTSSACYLLLTNHMQFKIYLNEDKIRQKQDELRNIRESIEMFYLPLNDLLTTYDENVIIKAKTRKIDEINGHKYLAEPRVRCVFEKYIQSNDGANRESNKLLELVRRDMKLLHNRFIELKMELKVE